MPQISSMLYIRLSDARLRRAVHVVRTPDEMMTRNIDMYSTLAFDSGDMVDRPEAFREERTRASTLALHVQ